MNVNSIYPSKYLKADDIPMGKSVDVTIRGLVMEDITGDKEVKPVLYFMKKEKGAVLNKTNCYILAMSLGEETDGWANKQIQIFTEMKTFQGKMVPGLSMRVPPGQPAAAPLAPAAQDVQNLAADVKAAENDQQATAGEFDDIPF